MRDFAVLPDSDEKVLGFAQKLLVAGVVLTEPLDVAQELLVTGVVLIEPNARDTKKGKQPVVAEVEQARERGRRAVVRALEVLAADERQELELVVGAQQRRVGHAHGDLAVHEEVVDGSQQLKHVGEGAICSG